MIVGAGGARPQVSGPDEFSAPTRFGLAGEGAVVRVDVDTGDVTVVAEGLGYPVSVRFDASGELLVAHLDPPSILRLVEATGTFETV